MAGEQLRVTEGKERGKLLNIEVDLVIGRQAPSADGRLGDDAAISRRHARVYRAADGSLTVEDLGSANGTFVNDERTDGPRKLVAGDVIRVGTTALQVTAAAGALAEPTPAGPVDEVDAVLIIKGGAQQGRRLLLTDELLIGREVTGEGKLGADPELSRRHARIARTASGRLTIEDLGSANGTYVNGERVQGRQVLEPGDSIRVGSTSLELAKPERAAAPPPAPPVPSPAREAPPPARAAPPPPSARPAPSPPPAAPAEIPLGSVFAGCRVEEVIGHGDMGVVYRADELALQRPVALKLILPDYSGDERFRERFRRESKIAAAIDHPNVIPVFDAGEEQGVLYIMMRLVEGTDLRALIAAEGPLEPLRAARIVRQVGAALDAAHARGMLHRDVKPSNVLLARRDHVYLSDFGLAKRAASREELTRHGTVVARAEYVAPEQVLGQRVDARADIYALGCLLFEALTGEAPFARSAVGPAALAHLEAPPPSVLELRPELPPAFEEVLHRAMAKDPAARYPSAGDLGQAALVAAGGLRQATPWSAVATGEAAVVTGDAAPSASTDAAPSPARQVAQRRSSDLVRWAVAIAGLLLVAVGMVAALHGISTL